MSAIDWTRVSGIFGDALELPPDQRETFVAGCCSGRPHELEAVRRLLAADQAADPGFPGSLDSAALEAAALVLEDAPKQIGPWRLVREIGEGGMGQVFLAERTDGQFDQRVAIKLLKRGMDSHAILARFLRERRILAGLDHPNIARLMDGGIAEDGRPYFVMEHVDGQTILRYADNHRLSVDARLNLFQQVCLALEYAHRNLVVHRDLKPSNIVVTSDGRPKLLDFGIAKLLATTAGEGGPDTLTEAGARPMTPEYAAPEQFAGGPISTSTDVYGLGVVLHELLGGSRPPRLAATSRAGDEPPSRSLVTSAITASIAAARSTDVTRLRRTLAGDLETIVATALRPQPERRYPSVGALREDIRRHQQRLPIKARPDTVGYRVSRFIGRNRIAVAAGTAMTLLLVAFLVTTVRQSRALEAERDRARAEAEAAEQVSDFLVGIFEVADPMKTGTGDSIRARELLDRGAERMAQDLDGQPELQARMLTLIGEAYHNLTRGDLAEPLLVRAVELQRAGPDGAPRPGYVASLRQLARVRAGQGDYPSMRELLQQALTAQQLIDPSDPLTGELLLELAGSYHMLGQRDSAELQVAKVMTLLGDGSPAMLQGTPELLKQLTRVLSYSQDWARLDRVHAGVVRAARVQARDGGGTGTVAVAYSEWAATKRRQGELEAADSLLLLALEVYGARGDRSAAEGRALNQLAAVAQLRGQPDRADSLYRTAVWMLEERLGPDHGLVNATLGGWAELHRKSGRYDEAIALYRRMLDSYRKQASNPAHIPVLQGRLAQALGQSGRLDEALTVFERSIAGHEERYPPDYILTARVRRDYAAALMDAGRHREAVAPLELAVPVLAKRWGEQDDRVTSARELLAAARAR
ncbi:MAG TPA: serine/threonine-protein kinase [Gemmatimonadales bacterium]|nr:serine/threonine-protein kinase [Gemmatimonadales bacterium]